MIQGKTDNDRFGRSPNSRLGEAILEARNEGLAKEMLCRLLAWRPSGQEHPPTWCEYFGEMLMVRAGNQWISGLEIEGPYLDALVKALLEHARDPSVHPGFGDVNRHRVAGVLVAYTQRHPKDKEVRSQVVEVLKTWAHLPQPGEREGRMASAWRGLIELGVLHEGMTIEEAKGILGEPAQASDTLVQWWHHWELHLAPPGINAEVRDGKATSFKLTQ